MPYLFYRKGLETSIPFHITDNVYIGRLTKNISMYDKNNEKIKKIESKFDIGDFRNNVVLDNKAVSGFHASIIRMSDNQYGLVDFNSKHFTFVNGKKIKPWQVIQLGDVESFNILDWNFIFIKNELKGKEEEYLTQCEDTETIMICGDSDVASKENLKGKLLEHNIIIDSEEMYKLYKKVELVAISDLDVMIIGERGTGKELLARAIHQWSNRRDKQYLVINTPTLNDNNLINSELFGHVKGAFTGASMARVGKFKEARDGTLFLDEIGDADINVQKKILRVIQEKEIQPVGSNNTIKVNTRVIAATNRSLKEINFREDLKDRFKITLEVPSLKKRKEEIPLLVKHFMEKFLSKHKRTNITLSDHVMELFNAHNWPGNVRELENIIENAIVFSENNTVIEPKNLMDYLPNESIIKTWLKITSGNFANGIKSLDDNEKEHIEKILKKNKWNKSNTAKELGIERPTLYSKIKKYSIKQ